MWKGSPCLVFHKKEGGKVDMCGAIAMKRHFPTTIIYISKDKELLIRDILLENYSIEEINDTIKKCTSDSHNEGCR